VIGADGIHSVVREAIVGPDEPTYTGRIAYRAIFPSTLLGGKDVGRSRTKWWGTDRHIVIYYAKPDKSEIYLIASVPESTEWLTRESWSTTGDARELRRAYEGFHPDVRAVVEACPACHKWATLERAPLARWSNGHVILLGDACHPMTPYMAQGRPRRWRTRRRSRVASPRSTARISKARSCATKRTASRGRRAFRLFRAPMSGEGRRRHVVALRLRRLERSLNLNRKRGGINDSDLVE
jgi:hypothetical protein